MKKPVEDSYFTNGIMEFFNTFATGLYHGESINACQKQREAKCHHIKHIIIFYEQTTLFHTRIIH